MRDQIKFRPLSTLLPVLALVSGLSACSGDEQGAMQAPPPEVGVAIVKTQAVTLKAELSGRTSAFQVSEVRPQITGILQQRLFTEGAQVEAGQVLYQVDAAPYQAAYDSAKASLAKAEAGVASARLLAERYAELSKIEAVSVQQNDDAQAAFLSAQAEVQAARAAVQTAKIELGYTRITAPIAGKISTSSVTPGALVTANQTEALTTVHQLDPIYVDISQSSTDLLKLRQQFAAGQLQQTGADKIEVRLKLEDGSTYVQPGTLAFTGVAVDEGTGTVKLRAIFPNPEGLLLPGMYVRAVIDQGVDPNGVLVPQVGVTRNARGEAITMVVGADNAVEQRTIQTGRAIGDQWQVLDGLEPGERIIVEGTIKVRGGATVRPVPVDKAAE